ncbi:hypothetical protein [Bacillus cereus]|uniref:Uncharacterized protein n=1 Tax=Bacillus cereus VD184 TaxID=1053242 RepID=A0A9W5VRS0_BACCE|nr:hypothetical protein [Bacillus cereus]EOQ07810.1 hypothetical protein IKC_00039 [Bacillus cereus VD184]
MDYEKMWKELKGHYENRVGELKDKQYPNPSNPRTLAKTIVNVMNHLELKNEKGDEK